MTKVCFILGIMPRSGTNFLENQLKLHPSCHSPGPIWEDFLISQLPALSRLVKKLNKQWDPRWFENNAADYSANCKASMGKGMEDFLLSQLDNSTPVKYLISKTPTVAGIEHFQHYFPDSKLLIVIRDGRSLIESGQRSFSWDFEKSAFDWSRNVRKIMDYLDINPMKSILIKFEDLCHNPQENMENIMEYLALDFQNYPQNKLDDLPVSGSSELKNKSKGLHWKPVKKDKTFKPTQRHCNWSNWKTKVFYYIAGREMTSVGYDFNVEITMLDKILIPLFLSTWPLRAFPKACFYLLKERKFILKTN